MSEAGEGRDTKVQAISIENLTKDYPLAERGRYVRAVDHLTLSIGQGCVFGLLGPNGSGKSTTIKILLGLTQASSGACRVMGSLIGEAKDRSRIGYLPDAPYYYRFLSGLELLLFYAKLMGVPKAERRERCLGLLRRFGIEDAATRKVSAYSKGMLQRLGFAQALLGDPDILVLDEPTAGVDPVGAAEVGDFILQLKEQGKTVLLCSHLLTQVQHVCDRVGIMNKGRLLAEGTVRDLLAGETAGSLRVEGLDAGAQRELESWVAQRGGRLAGAPDSLDAYFCKLVAKDRLEP